MKKQIALLLCTISFLQFCQEQESSTREQAIWARLSHVSLLFALDEQISLSIHLYEIEEKSWLSSLRIQDTLQQRIEQECIQRAEFMERNTYKDLNISRLSVEYIVGAMTKNKKLDNKRPKLYPLNKEIITDCLEILGNVQAVQAGEPCPFADQSSDGNKYIPLYLKK